MSIYIKNQDGFTKVKKVMKKNADDYKHIQRVYVHDGTKFVMVHGRLFEVVWEYDMTDYGINNTANYYDFTQYNASRGFEMLPNGNLINVVAEYAGNGTIYENGSNRRAILVFDKDTADFTYWYGTWQKYQLGYTGDYFYEQPIGVIKCGENYCFYSSHGCFYMFSPDGVHRATQYNTSWYQYIGNRIIIAADNDLSRVIKVAVYQNPEQSLSSDVGTIYFKLNKYDNTDNISDNNITSCYGITYQNATLGNSFFRYYKGYNTNYGQGVQTSIICDPTTGNVVMYYYDTLSSVDYWEGVMVTLEGGYTSSMDVNPVCITRTTGKNLVEFLFAKDGFVYSIEGSYLTKRSISNHSLIWSIYYTNLQTPGKQNPYSGETTQAKSQPCSPYGDGFMFPNGCVVYPDGTVSKVFRYNEEDVENDKYGTGRFFQQIFDENLGIGYFNHYVPNCYSKLYKVKEVVK